MVVERAPREQDMRRVLLGDNDVAGAALEGVEPVLELLGEVADVLDMAVLVGELFLLIKRLEIAEKVEFRLKRGEIFKIAGTLQGILEDLNLLGLGELIQESHRSRELDLIVLPAEHLKVKAPFGVSLSQRVVDDLREDEHAGRQRGQAILNLIRQILGVDRGHVADERATDILEVTDRHLNRWRVV